MLDLSRERAVTLQFSTERAISSAMIRWFTHSDFSHVDLVLPDGRLLGARSAREGSDTGIPGVAIRPRGYADFSRTLQIRVATNLAGPIYRWALSARGASYDMRAICAFGLARNWRDRSRFFCSELVAWAFEGGGFFGGRNIALPPSRITPGDVILLLSPWAEVIGRYPTLTEAAFERPFS